MHAAARYVLSVLFPRKCISCGEFLTGEEFLCSSCKKQVVVNKPPYCTCCGVSLQDCRCRKRSRAYKMAVAPFYYEGAVKNALLRLKYKKAEEVSFYFGASMQQCIEERLYGVPIDLITCVPSTPERIAERGYNQAQTLAEQINASAFSWLSEAPERDYKLLKKTDSGTMQHLLGAEARRQNIRDSFHLNKGRKIEGKTILLVDDILTTGATAEELTVLLRLHGAKAVYIATAAVTRIDDKSKMLYSKS